MDDNFEVITTLDKDARDRMYEDFRKNGNALEKQVVKYSSVESYSVEETTENGTGLVEKFRSTYSVAYPRS